MLYHKPFKLPITHVTILLTTLAAASGCSGENIVDVDVGLAERPSNSTCIAKERPVLAGAQVQLTRVFEQLQLNQPLYALQVPGDDSRWYIVEKPGRVLVVENRPDVAEFQVFVDLTDRVIADPRGETGLLGMAFDPDYAENRRVYLSYTGDQNGLESRISRFKASSDSQSLDKGSEEILLRQPQFASNHNGGWIGFGPDGYLYLGFGDGGGADDPQKTGQKLDTLLGKVIRIDVRPASGIAIPSDNPFANGGGRPEIYAIGFRNPWRMSFDRETGELWAADVGQNRIEEVDIVRKGGNYGWSIKEGTECFQAASCNGAELVDPVHEYDHSQGESITGGYVYHGSRIPGLVGQYLFGDFTSGRLWALAPTEEGYSASQLLETGLNIASFAEGNDGELYLLDLGGQIYRIDPVEESPQPISDFPEKLSETGCFDPADPRKPAEALVPYDLNAPLWSDGAAKERWMALPDNTYIEVKEDGDWEFPIGTVLVKQFRIDGRLVETRLMMRHTDGDWGGYTYAWNPEQTDAELLATGKRVSVSGRSWLVPSRAQCLQCHTKASGRSLGLETAQLNRSFVYKGGQRANQLRTLEGIGMFAQPLGAVPEELPALASYEGDGAVADKARAYLHSNCSHCHRPEGPGRGNMDLRATLGLGQIGACGVTPEHGNLSVENPLVIAPGEPERSVLWLRMRTLGADRMPPLASERMDEQGTGLIEGWIQGLAGCE